MNCPKGIDICFDNVGEDTLYAVLKLMNKLGRIALCGAMKTYSNFNNKYGIANYNIIITK
jgi:NADPH-dependent curcumin reductase CurA